MTIYTSSRHLKIDASVEVKLLSASNIKSVQEEDIIISTGSIRDDLMLRNLIDKKILPFIVTFTTAPKVSSLLENLSLIINKEITTIDASLISNLKSIYHAIINFEINSNFVIEEEKSLEELKLLLLSQQLQLLSSQQRDEFKSDDEPIQAPRRDVYLEIKSNRQTPLVFVILHDDDSLRVFKIEVKTTEQEQQFIYNFFSNNFEAYMQGEKLPLKKRKLNFDYKEITQQYEKDFLLFGMEEKDDFESYALYDIEEPKVFKNMALYEVNTTVKQIDEKGELALETLRSAFRNPNVQQRNLDVFLYSARKFPSIISSIQYDEQSKLKRDLISNMFIKIYDNMTEKRGTSQLRFALVLLFSKDFDTLNIETKSCMFYDINNNINTNAQVLKSAGREALKEKNELEKKTLEFDEGQKEHEIEVFFQQNDAQKFIYTFLNSLTAINSATNIDERSTLQFIALLSYLNSSTQLNITQVKKAVEKIDISYSFLAMIRVQIQANLNELFLYIDDFVNIENPQENIETYLQKTTPYTYSETNSQSCITIFELTYNNAKNTLRQEKSRFFSRLRSVGDFYKYFSQQQIIEEILNITLQKIKTKDFNIEECCQEKKVFNFLKIFFKGHGKKNCHLDLKDFLEKGHILLNSSH
ncbi:MAG: Unknown protein [uncultured Sulfurovum sp.]|uniref:Uncharacterized protein n=1 Tax=uncultured Sulfurovum sp. TaxID=269237 RepID=A0A6S6S0W9_9BACT|nr:MAG: Unknown protein [uncultured Sulfurovum sp.]